MANMTDYLENALLNHIFNNTQMGAISSAYLGLFSVAPTESTGGTELTGNGYARQAISMGSPSAGVIATDADIVFTASGADWSNAVAWGIFDSSTGGNLLYYGTLIPNKTVTNGNTLTILAGNLTVTQD